jgi:hypothetical protein
MSGSALRWRSAAIDENGTAIYVADIIYRSDAIKMHIDLLANARASAKSERRVGGAKNRSAQGHRARRARLPIRLS